jgi:hypothetical protein
VGHAVSERVECHSGYTYAEKPAALWWEGQRLEIAEVETEWRIPGGRCFRVRTQENRRFELIYGELNDEWQINPI